MKVKRIMSNTATSDLNKAAIFTAASTATAASRYIWELATAKTKGEAVSPE